MLNPLNLPQNTRITATFTVSPIMFDWLKQYWEMTAPEKVKHLCEEVTRYCLEGQNGWLLIDFQGRLLGFAGTVAQFKEPIWTVWMGMPDMQLIDCERL